MSVHSYSRCWLHMIWTTLNRERMLFGEVAGRVSDFLSNYSESKGIFMKVNYVNPEHVHALIDLPTQYSIEDIFKLIKGASSHWINQNRLVRGKFFWGRGYGVFSVSQSNFAQVTQYIAAQEGHHRKRTFLEEYQHMIKRYGLEWRGEETVKTVTASFSDAETPR